MKLLILGAGVGCECIEKELSRPKCMTMLSNGKMVLDNIIESAHKAGIADIAFVGGDNIVEVMHSYPELSYFYAKDSDVRGNLHSLNAAKSFLDEDVVVVYGDVLFDASLFSLLRSANAGVVFSFDSLWKTRYEGRSQILLDEAEKAYKKKNGVIFSRVPQDLEVLGEFAGVVLFRREALNCLAVVLDEITKKNLKATILDALNHSNINKLISSVDIKGRWAELDSSQDINAFRFGTKADTLKGLLGRLQRSIILPQVSFTVSEWREDRVNILNSLQKSFNNPSSLIVRSSAINEDTKDESLAGNFESILNIDASNHVAIQEAVDTVIDCYRCKEGYERTDNQIFVQPYLDNVEVSGVAFTRDLETKAPYYVVNYDDNSKRTDTVTSGISGKLKTYVVNKFSPKTAIPWLNDLLISLEEIEAVTNTDFLDVEFAIKGANVYLLQVRPIAAHKNELRLADTDFVKAIESIKHYLSNHISSPQIGLQGNKTAYGVMPDWNPAEIIGVSPKPLALSLYKELITDQVWPKSREHLGYYSVGNNFGMVAFCGRPYIDLRVSFNSFIPQTLDEGLCGRLSDYYIEYLRAHRYLHDKVEFDVAITCYSFDIDRLVYHLTKGGFSLAECYTIVNAYQLLTKDIVKNGLESINNIMNKALVDLETRRECLSKSKMSETDKIYHYVQDCKKYGTFYFAVLARYAFIATNLMRSFVSMKLISEIRLNDFFATISTIPKMLIEDMSMLEQADLIQKYGHLRPGTYDIESRSYKDLEGIFGNGNTNKVDRSPTATSSFSWTLSERLGMEDCLRKAGYPISFENFMDFIVAAIEAREFSKFIFTKSVCEILDTCSALGKSVQVSKEEISFLKINDFLKYYGANMPFNLENEWRNEIKYNKKGFLLTHSLKMPSLIFDEADLDFHNYDSEEPNFITNMKCVAPIIKLDGYDGPSSEIDGKIVVIEKADPGYDWIFTYDVKGLVTKFGGIASHMSIRCAELCIPAGIGCGELIFQSICASNVIELDCSSRKIRLVS